jgi:hypothetical protein
MTQYEVIIPRLVQMIEYETIIVEANNTEEAKNNALIYDNVIGGSQWHEEDHETIQRYDDEIQIKEIIPCK